MITLYKTDTKGKIRVLHISTEGDELVQKSGLFDGALVEHRKTCKPKNVGKSNETTGERQALLEMESKALEKLSEGYFKSLEDCQQGEVILPMLAKDYKSESKKINWNLPVYIQPKLDGMRCLAHIEAGVKVELISRTGKVIENMDHIKKILIQSSENIILDGELYLHGQGFQRNMELIKKYRPGETEDISFHIYDVVLPQDSFKTRNQVVEAAVSFFRGLPGFNNEIIPVETVSVENEEDIKDNHKCFLTELYEGSIIRHGDAGYKISGRSDSLLKYKNFIDLAVPIKDIEPADARPDWGVPVFSWDGATNNELRAGVKMSHEQRKDLLLNKKDYIGKMAELRFFEYSTTGVPRFPVMVGIRLDK